MTARLLIESAALSTTRMDPDTKTTYVAVVPTKVVRLDALLDLLQEGGNKTCTELRDELSTDEDILPVSGNSPIQFGPSHLRSVPA